MSFVKQIVQTKSMVRLLQVDQRRVSLTHGDDILALNLRQQLAEPPPTTYVFRTTRRAAFSPDLFERQSDFPSRARPLLINHLQKLRAVSAAEIWIGFGLHRSALHATQYVRGYRRLRKGGFHCVPEVTERAGPMQPGIAAAVLPQNSSCTART